MLSSFAESGTAPKIDFSPLWEVLKIIVPALTVWLGVRATARKDQREFELRQQDKLNTSWSEMTAQSREIIAGLQREVVEARMEVEKLKLECDGLRRELHELELEVRKKNTRVKTQ